MSLVHTEKFVGSDDLRAATRHAQAMTGPASGMVITDRKRWPEGAKGPRTEGEIARGNLYALINEKAVELGLDPPEEFIDEDGDLAVNNYGLDFETGEILFWDRSSGQDAGPNRIERKVK
jgi:hypothetical protein